MSIKCPDNFQRRLPDETDDFSVSVSKYFVLTGFTMKCNADARLTSPAQVYMVLL